MKRKLQIFISSTFSDLKEERQACVEAILRAGHIPAGMELFSAGNESQLEVIKRWIEDSDIYMLLLGGRYGSIEPKSGMSYTEIEYRYAVESGKPFFALVMTENSIDEKLRREGKEILELEQRQKYKDFKSLVLSKISKFFADENEIKLAILESIIDIQNRNTLTGWVKASEIPDITQVNQIPSQESSDELSDEAKTLLIEASQDPHGLIQSLRYSGGVSIEANHKNFVRDSNPRTTALWESAIDQLAQKGLIRSLGYKNEVFKITSKGYAIADRLKQNLPEKNSGSDSDNV